MKLNLRHRLGLKAAKVLPAPWSWKLLKIPCRNVLARDCGSVIREVREDLSSVIPLRQGTAGEIVGSEVFTFADAYSTHWGASLTSNGELIADLSRQGAGIGIDKAHFAFGKPRIKQARRFRGTVAALTIEHRSNYFHYLCDAVSRLQLVENLRHRPDFIYIQGNHKYQRQILSRLGYGPEQIIDSSRHSFIQADELIVPSYVSNFSFLTVNSISFLRSRLKKNPSANPVSRGRILYISRKDTPRRKIVNEAKVLESLARFRVEPVVLSHLSFDQQIELFEGADAVITVTGAGLANLIFARPDLFLILITPPNWFGESALEIVKPFGLKLSNIVVSNYPEASDPFSQDIHMTEKEIEDIAHALTSLNVERSP